MHPEVSPLPAASAPSRAAAASWVAGTAQRAPPPTAAAVAPPPPPCFHTLPAAAGRPASAPASTARRPGRCSPLRQQPRAAATDPRRRHSPPPPRCRRYLAAAGPTGRSRARARRDTPPRGCPPLRCSPAPAPCCPSRVPPRPSTRPAERRAPASAGVWASALCARPPPPPSHEVGAVSAPPPSLSPRDPLLSSPLLGPLAPHGPLCAPQLPGRWPSPRHKHAGGPVWPVRRPVVQGRLRHPVGGARRGGLPPLCVPRRHRRRRRGRRGGGGAPPTPPPARAASPAATRGEAPTGAACGAPRLEVLGGAPAAPVAPRRRRPQVGMANRFFPTGTKGLVLRETGRPSHGPAAAWVSKLTDPTEAAVSLWAGI